MEYNINNELLEKYLVGFKAVLTKDGEPFSLTAANKTYNEEEMYKYKVAEDAESLLKRSDWKRSYIGKGTIFKHVQSAMQVSANLVNINNRLKFYDKCELDLGRAEEALYMLYRGGDDERAFNMITEVFGRVYDVIGFLFFIHDSKRYLPIASDNFDLRFNKLGIDYKTAGKCSWENYTGFIQIISDIRYEMQEYYDIAGVNLLDAHSFVWMLPKIDDYYDEYAEEPYFIPVLGDSKLAEVSVRIGQSKYRKNLLEYWNNKCSVTGCSNKIFLTASHIKPWRDSNSEEKGDVYNGFLLIPNLDIAFDGGFITFDNDGSIVISKELSADDCIVLGINKDMKLRKIEDKHREYLEYHRNYIFKG